jgi:cyclopropane fatty-acyl-phospholipid synthase-like methyltransferase
LGCTESPLLVESEDTAITEPSDVETAWSKQYDKLARIFAKALGNGTQEIAEIGCGSGRLTIPLAKQASDMRFVLVDTFANPRTGSYSNKRYRALISNLKKANVFGRVRIVAADYMEWIKKQDYETYDAIISSEFVPEITSGETRAFIRECYRVLKPTGKAIHSFLSPVPRNHAQKLLIEADSNPAWTRTPPKEWFSPKPALVITELRRAGFRRIRHVKLESHLVVKAAAAESLLRSWEVKPKFYESHRVQLEMSGLEVPDWIIVSGIKP